jgi:putative transposase
MRQIETGTRVTLKEPGKDPAEYLALDFKKGLVLLRHLGTGEEDWFDPLDIARMWIGPGDRWAKAQPGDLDRIGKAKRKLAAMWADHLEELDTGKRLNGEAGSPRPEYEPSLSLTTRVATKSREMRILGIPCSTSTIKRRLRAYQTVGIAGLVDRRQLRQYDPLKRADARVIEALATVIARETNQSTGTVGRLRFRLKKELLLKYPGKVVKMPPPTTLWRYCQIMTRGKHTFRNATSRSSKASVPDRMFHPRTRFMMGREAQMDATVIDVAVLNDKGKRERPLLTVIVDVDTEMIIASTIRLRGTKGFDHAVTLGRCLVPRPLRPGYERLKAAAGRGLGETQLPDPLPAEDFAVPARPYFIPQRIVTDNARDFRSEVLRAMCEKYGISLTEASLHTGSDKPLVERTFETIKTGFSQYMPGYTGGSAATLGSHSKQEDLFDVFTLNEVFEDWVDLCWERWRRKGLADPVHPAESMSPQAVMAAMAEVRGAVQIPFGADDYIESMPSKGLCIQPNGITCLRRTYDSVELFPFRGQPSPETHSKKWRVHYNPYDPFAVWIKDPRDGRWIECNWTKASALTAPFSASVRSESRRIATEMGVLEDEDAVELTMNIIARGSQEKRRMERMAARSAVALGTDERSGLPVPHPPAKAPKVSAAPDNADGRPLRPQPAYPVPEWFDPEKDLM